ncbi:MAG: cell division protein ZapA [Gemmatimonadota bacterium]
MTGDGQRKTVRVTIFGEDYQIRTDLGEEYTQECARYVDDAIQAAHIAGHISEAHKAAILAAMKITDELFRARARGAGLEQRVRERLSDLAERLEAIEPRGADGGGPTG